MMIDMKSCYSKTKKGVRCTKAVYNFLYCKQHWKIKLRKISLMSIVTLAVTVGAIYADVYTPLYNWWNGGDSSDSKKKSINDTVPVNKNGPVLNIDSVVQKTEGNQSPAIIGKNIIINYSSEEGWDEGLEQDDSVND